MTVIAYTVLRTPTQIFAALQDQAWPWQHQTDHTTLTAVPGSPLVTLTVPLEARPGLDRLWVAHADRFQLTLCRLRIPTLPLGTESRT